MRRMLVFTLLALAAIRVLRPRAAPTGSSGTTGGTPAPELDEQRLGVYSALIEELVGRADGLARVYVLTGLCADAADPMGPKACDDSLSEAERAALRERLAIEHLRFIDDPTPLYDDDWMQGRRGEIVSSRSGRSWSEPVRSGSGASYGCGGLCGSGDMYVLEESGGDWSVVGQRGPMWIA